MQKLQEAFDARNKNGVYGYNMYLGGKGCGIHSLADIGFEGAKAKRDGQSVSAVNIYLGGKLISQDVEGYSIIKNVPLDIAKLYIKELMVQYKTLALEGESFEEFHDRVLSLYSKPLLGFFIHLKAYLRSKNINLDLNIDEITPCAKVEEYEIFNLGRKIYFKYTNHTPVKEYQGLTNKNPNEKIEPLNKLVTNLDENINTIVSKTLDIQDKRALVFSELLEYIAL